MLGYDPRMIEFNQQVPSGCVDVGVFPSVMRSDVLAADNNGHLRLPRGCE
jgi:hypothetical protein